MLAFGILRALWRAPYWIRQRRQQRRHARGRHAITHGLLAIGHGDSASARRHADVARRHAAHDPLSLLLHAQAAQLEGDRDGAKAAFRAMAEREDTRLLGLRGLFIEAQRSDDAVSAVMIAEEALALAPASSWASHAVLGFRCANGDWSGALAILENNFASGLVDKATHRRQRGVLLTARALELENVDRDLSRESVMEAVRLAPTLVPAAVLASKYESEAHQVRRAMRTVEAAWLANPHPDLADAYAHVRLGDSARERLARIEKLAAKSPGHIEGALAVARAAIDAAEFSRAREVLAPFVDAPTQRVALLMAELERSEHHDSGRAREWTLRAVRALHDPVWTADGYVSERWRPVSPVTGRLDAFQWQTPVAALPSGSNAAIESESDKTGSVPTPRRIGGKDLPEPAGPAEAKSRGPAQDDLSVTFAEASPETAPPATTPTAPAESSGQTTMPLFRDRQGQNVPDKAVRNVPPVIPIVRAPDDPGIDDETGKDEFAEQIAPKTGQTGGWRGFLSRWSR
jgi:HemY protein